MIPVTRPHLPDLRKYHRYLEGIYERGWLTNAGPLVRELTERLEEYLGVENLLLVANGTLALQVAFRALDLRGSVITTPFSFAATTGALLWEGLTPVFADIQRRTLNLDPQEIPGLLGDHVAGIVPVHVYGTPCDVSTIDRIAGTAGIKVVYDAAHAFAVTVRGQTVLNHGDASTLSFHATKVFHSVEGGAIVFRDPQVLERARRIINFGLPATREGRIPEIGINAKLSELHAAMGLCVLDDIDMIIETRLERLALYRKLLGGHVEMLSEPPDDIRTNGGYMPIFLRDRQERDRLASTLAAAGVTTRRYFWPSLELAYGNRAQPSAPVARNLSERVLCLPIYADLSFREIERLCACVRSAARSYASVVTQDPQDHALPLPSK